MSLPASNNVSVFPSRSPNPTPPVQPSASDIDPAVADRVIPGVSRRGMLRFLRLGHWEVNQFSGQREYIRNWGQGEHFAIMGPTGVGKTYFGAQLMPIRDWNVVIASKREDETLEEFKRTGLYTVINTWPPRKGLQKVVLHAYPEDLDDYSPLGPIKDTLNGVYKVGGWSIFLDDMQLLSQEYGLEANIRRMFNMVRASHTSLVAGIPRPERVPVEVRTQASHWVAFGYENLNQVDSVADVMGINHDLYRKMNAKLGERDFVYKRRRKPAYIIRG